MDGRNGVTEIFERYTGRFRYDWMSSFLYLKCRALIRDGSETFIWNDRFFSLVFFFFLQWNYVATISSQSTNVIESRIIWFPREIHCLPKNVLIKLFLQICLVFARSESLQFYFRNMNYCMFLSFFFFCILTVIRFLGATLRRSLLSIAGFFFFWSLQNA